MIAAVPECSVYYTHDSVGFELICGDVTLAAGRAAQVS